MTLRVPGRRYLEADERGLPVATHEVQGTDLDYREPRLIGEAQLDTCFTELTRDPDHLARVEVRAGNSQAILWMDDAFGYVMVFTGDTLGPKRRRRGLAVEPMTCPPDALRSGESLVRLAPGKRFHGRWGISLRS
jgi:aldose 1-epimerase